MHIETDSLPLMNTFKYVFPFTFFKVRKSNKKKTMNFFLLGGQLLQWNLEVIYVMELARITPEMRWRHWGSLKESYINVK